MGFANLPNQVHRKSVKKGFEFTLMVVGEYDLLHNYFDSIQEKLTYTAVILCQNAV